MNTIDCPQFKHVQLSDDLSINNKIIIFLTILPFTFHFHSDIVSLT